ncbi:hypothetical protein OC842_008009 [Tilletia horrida]|uniref:Uncharacterized protein n=1 Tax=Tilletia horrida TaxID=155126 RepID=A0AAN6G2L9_9BASI|nr:hypothetical protein OC842_008009 [Tilletia horrida]
MARASIARKTTGGMAPRRRKAKEAAAVRLRRRQSRPNFTKATKSWRGQQLDVGSAGNNEALITVPIQFLVYGRCDSAAYVLDMIHLCFEECGALMDSTTQAVQSQSQAISTLPNLDVLFCRDDGAQIRTGRRVEGPRVEPVKWPAEHEAPVGFAETALRRQHVALAFKTAAIARDGTCLLPGTYHGEGSAIHIAGDRNRPQYGLLLCKDLAQAFQQAR